MTKTLTWVPASRPGLAVLRLTARVLRRAGHLLERRARAHGRAERATSDLPMVEFHAEAGAPEGALYVNGRFVGNLPGVTRL